jgi:hypothetical protein
MLRLIFCVGLLFPKLFLQAQISKMDTFQSDRSIHRIVNYLAKKCSLTNASQNNLFSLFKEYHLELKKNEIQNRHHSSNIQRFQKSVKDNFENTVFLEYIKLLKGCPTIRQSKIHNPKSKIILSAPADSGNENFPVPR